MNTNPIKNPNTGKFQKKVEPVELSNAEFIKMVQNELYAGSTDLERINKAYRLICPDCVANNRAMRIAILNYEEAGV